MVSELGKGGGAVTFTDWVEDLRGEGGSSGRRKVPCPEGSKLLKKKEGKRGKHLRSKHRILVKGGGELPP